jgi:hypothetical protein
MKSTPEEIQQMMAEQTILRENLIQEAHRLAEEFPNGFHLTQVVGTNQIPLEQVGTILRTAGFYNMGKRINKKRIVLWYKSTTPQLTKIETDRLNTWASYCTKFVGMNLLFDQLCQILRERSVHNKINDRLRLENYLGTIYLSLAEDTPIEQELILESVTRDIRKYCNLDITDLEAQFDAVLESRG